MRPAAANWELDIYGDARHSFTREGVLDQASPEAGLHPQSEARSWRTTLELPRCRSEYLGSLDRVTRIVRLGVAVASSEDVREHPKVTDGASELLQDVFGKDKNPSRLVYGVASLPLGSTVELEVIFEVA